MKDIKIYEKPVMTKFATIEEVEFKLSYLYDCLDQLLTHTKEDDRYGDYSLRDYEVRDCETMEKLVKIGLVKNYTGSRMANLFCMKDEESINNLLNALSELDKPTEVEEKCGNWDYSPLENIAICSECGYEHYLGAYHQYATNFCPNCGHKMKPTK